MQTGAPGGNTGRTRDQAVSSPWLRGFNALKKNEIFDTPRNARPGHRDGVLWLGRKDRP
jgi:hypothetical protein